MGLVGLYRGSVPNVVLNERLLNCILKFFLIIQCVRIFVYIFNIRKVLNMFLMIVFIKCCETVVVAFHFYMFFSYQEESFFLRGS